MIRLIMVNTTFKHKREHGRDRGGEGGQDHENIPTPHKHMDKPYPHPSDKEMEQSNLVCCHGNACCQGSIMCVREGSTVWTCKSVGGVG